MADLVSVQEGLPVRISGVSNISGIPDNFADVLSTGQLKVAISDASGNSLSSTSNALDVYLTNATVAVTQSSGPWTQNLTEVGGTAISLGQTTAANSVPVTLAALPTFQTSQYTIGTSATQITPTPLANRGGVGFKALTTLPSIAIYIGNSSGVTSSTGYPLFNKDTLDMDLDSGEPIWAISTAASQTLYVIEIGG